MKRSISVILLLALAFSLVACGNNNTPYVAYPAENNNNAYNNGGYGNEQDPAYSYPTAGFNNQTTLPQLPGLPSGYEPPTTPAPAVPTVIYSVTNYDHFNYKNEASIEAVDINNGKLFITYTIRAHRGGSYDSFATDAIFYDANNNIIDMRQVMYASNISSAIGQSFVDDAYIPNGTSTILINSTDGNAQYRVSTNHGNPSITLDIPDIVYDHKGYGSSVSVDSYNVYNEKLFLTFTTRTGTNNKYYTSHATEIIFYSASGAVLDTKQALYARNLDNGIGITYFDDYRIPDGTAKIVIPAGSPGSSDSGSSVPSNPSTPTTPTTPTTPVPDEDEEEETTTPTQPAQPNPAAWTPAEVEKLQGYFKSAQTQLSKAQSNCKKGQDEYYVLAAENIKLAASYVRNALSLIKANSDVTLTTGTSLTAETEALLSLLLELSNVTINLDNVASYKERIINIAYTGAVDVGNILIIVAKMKAAS